MVGLQEGKKGMGEPKGEPRGAVMAVFAIDHHNKVRKKDLSRAHTLKKGLTMSLLINSDKVTESELLYLDGKEQIKIPLAQLTVEQYLTRLKKQIENCRPFLEHAGTNVTQVYKSACGLLSDQSVVWEWPVGITTTSRILQITNDFMLGMMLGFGKGASFIELSPPPEAFRAWSQHFLCIGGYGQFLLMSISYSTNSPGRETIQVRLLVTSESFLTSLFIGLPELRIVCLQRLGSMLDQQVRRYERRLTALREAQGVLRITLERAV